MSSTQNNQPDSNQSDNNPSDNNGQQVKVNETLPMAFPVSGNATYASVPPAQTITQTGAQNSEQTIQYIPLFTLFLDQMNPIKILL